MCSGVCTQYQHSPDVPKRKGEGGGKCMQKTDTAFLIKHPEFVSIIEQGAGISWFHIMEEKSHSPYGRAVVDMMLALARSFPQYLERCLGVRVGAPFKHII